MDSFPLAPIRRSPLHYDRCLTLLCGTADPASPLHLLRGDANILSMILDLALPVWRTQAQAIDLVNAARNGLVREVHAKLHLTDVDVNAEDSRGAIAVHSAAYNGHAEALQLLLQCGGDPNRAIKNGSTAMHSASYSGHVDALRLLLQYGGDPNGASDINRDKTPVHLAAYYGHTEALELLEAAGGKP